MDNRTQQTPTQFNGWTKWGQYVLKELERQDIADVDLAKRVNKLEIENAVLKIKSGTWGVIGALIPIIIVIIIWLIKSNILDHTS